MVRPLDRIAASAAEKRSPVLIWIERGFAGSILLMAIAAPVSIAGTQIAWSLAMLFWLLRLAFCRPKEKIKAIDLAVLAFLGLTILSCAFSYEPEVSFRKLASVSLVSIAYLVYSAVRDLRTLRTIVILLLASAVVSAFWAFGVQIVGKNLKIRELSPTSPLISVGVEPDDTILSVNHRNIDSPSDLDAAMAATSGDEVVIQLYRHEFINDRIVPMSSLPTAGDALSRLGIQKWSRGRDTRATGFYGHYITYAEALQLLISLAFGLAVTIAGRSRRSVQLVLFGVCIVLGMALLLTVTRSSWAAAAVSAAIIVVLGTSKQTILIAAALALPIAIAGSWYLSETRKVTFIDSSDDSTAWRAEVWHEGFDVLTLNARHMAFGIGMDSLKTHWQDWGMFENGRRPLGHMHSTPLQLAFERGMPTLMAWIVWMILFLQLIWRGYRDASLGWFERGFLLGALGGTVGFLVSGLVQYNWGDSEDVMILYIIMGLTFTILRRPAGEPLPITE